MMKKIRFLLCLIFAGINLQAQNLIKNPEFKENFKGYWKNKFSKYTVANGILCISGTPEAGEKENHNLLMTGLLTGNPADYSENTYVLSFSAKTGTISGICAIAVREASGKDYAKLHRIVLCKWDSNTDWKTYRLKFTCRTNVREMRLNFLAQGLSAQDSVQIKEIRVEKCISRSAGNHQAGHQFPE